MSQIQEETWKGGPLSITAFTPAYNRAHTLGRVWESLRSQTYRNFEWVIVDDGSVDDTRQVVEAYIKQADFPIRYFYQENNGKHMAFNRAVSEARGELFVVADSDDTFVPEAFATLVRCWEEIPEDQRDAYRGITCRCYDPETGRPIGEGAIPEPWVDCTEIEAVFLRRFRFEMWGMTRTEVLREFPFPNIPGGQKSGLKFFPEIIIYDRIAAKYRSRYINQCLRGYYRDQANATTVKKGSRYKENYYLWAHYINDLFAYFRYDPKRFLKAFVGLVRDGKLSGRTMGTILQDVHGAGRKLLVLLFSPVGLVLWMRGRRC